MSFAAKLKRLRLRSGASLQELADAIGISKAHLWDLETGKSGNPSVDLLKKLSNHFQVSIASLAGEEEGEDTDEELKVMFRRFQELDEKDRAVIKAVIDEQQRQKKKESGDAN